MKLVTTWTCSAGHEDHCTIDMGDPADWEHLNRIKEDIRFDGCREVVDGVRCSKLVKRNETQVSDLWDSSFEDYSTN